MVVGVRCPHTDIQRVKTLCSDKHTSHSRCLNLLSLVQEGLRTLCVAYRALSPEQYEEVCHLLNGAKLALQDRDKRLAEAYDLIEKDLILLGATAVEDRWRKSYLL